MGLTAYRKRRDFEVTPEPAGGRARKPKRLSFVIQRHDATRLHYDFRLELDGVLKSWAVPKGPSIDPADRRLAVEVEDHPLTYGSFEGTIPKGQYGAGTVEIWDKGYWTPEGDPHSALRRGSLHFELQGEKLAGRWHLVRMKLDRTGAADKQQWLLVKSRQASDGQQAVAAPIAKRRAVAKAKPAIAAKPGRLRAGRDSLPQFVEPQLATLVETAPDSDDWLHEIKFDGYRLQARIECGNVVLRTRSGKDWTAKFTGVAEALATLKVDRALIDGEVAVTDEQGVTHFALLQDALGRGESQGLTYHVFDLLHLNGRDLTRETLEGRKTELQSLVDNSQSSIVRFSGHIEGRGAEFHRAACGKGLEGVISKRRDGIYTPGRTREWVKSKCRHRQEFVIGGYTGPRGERENFGALLVGAYDAHHSLRYCGRVGTGFNAKTLRSLFTKLAAAKRATTPFETPPRDSGVHWVKPALVAEVSFENWTHDNLLRQAAFVGLREDKAAASVTVERAAGAKPARVRDVGARGTRARERSDPETPPRASETSNEDRVAGVTITHPTRVIYPPEGITKLHLAHYIEQVAPWMLPHVIDRPLMVLRCPAGVGKPCFIQKNAHVFSRAKVAARASARPRSSSTGELWVHDLTDLIRLVQNNAIEIHTAASRRAEPQRPDRLIFDLDPHESVTWARVIEVARDLKRRLAAFELPAFVKTTGGKGLHVAVPLRTLHTWDQVRAAATRIATTAIAESPDDLTLNISKRKRVGKIFIDTLRNLRGATCVAPYSPRAREGATISLPVTWAKLTPGEGPEAFAIGSWAGLAKRRADPWRQWEGSRARLPAALTRAKRR